MSERRLNDITGIIDSIRASLDTGFAAAKDLSLALDYAPGTTYSRIPTTFSAYRPFGDAQIENSELDKLVKREPVIHWTTWYVAQDIFDNGFKALLEGQPNDDTFDKAVQKVLSSLDAKNTFVRSTAFERLYGTSVILCAYTMKSGESWETPVYDDNGNFRGGGRQLLQVTPYPWSQVSVLEKEKDEGSLRFGLPKYYEISRNTDVSSPLKVHWTRVIHDAPRRFNDSYEGMSIVEVMYDDATAFRNMRWGLYQTIFRYGSGFPHIHLPWANRKQIEAMISRGEFDYLNSRGFFVTGGREENKETIEFKGVQDVTLNPTPYKDIAFESFSLGSRIPQDIFKGASAGRITGSEFNERNYYKYISSEQSSKEKVVCELINRLIDTGQIRHPDGRKRYNKDMDYILDWYSAYELNEVDRTRIMLWEATAYKGFTEFMTVDEVRELKKLSPLPDGAGKTVIGLERIKAQQMRTEFNPSQQRKGQTQPNEGEPQQNRPEER